MRILYIFALVVMLTKTLCWTSYGGEALVEQEMRMHQGEGFPHEQRAPDGAQGTVPEGVVDDLHPNGGSASAGGKVDSADDVDALLPPSGPAYHDPIDRVLRYAHSDPIYVLPVYTLNIYALHV